MANYAMTTKGTHYTEGPVTFSWAINRDESEVIAIDDDDVTPRLQEHILGGRVTKTDRKATVKPRDESPTRKLMTGDEAAAYKAIPAGPVYVYRMDPATGEQMKIALTIPGHTVPIQEDLSTPPQPNQELPDESDANEEPEEETAEQEAEDERTVAELRAELQAKGLSTSGTKAELKARLESGES